MYNIIIDDGIKYYHTKNKVDDLNKKEFSKYKDAKEVSNYINVRFTLLGSTTVPSNIDVLYYKG